MNADCRMMHAEWFRRASARLALLFIIYSSLIIPL
jgi:hypothetical protein